MVEIYCRAEGVELTQAEVEEVCNNKEYIVTSTAIWQPHFQLTRSSYISQRLQLLKGLQNVEDFTN